MAIVKFTSGTKGLSTILAYITQEGKTEPHLISGQNCMPESALSEMNTIKNLYGKNDKRQYIHIMQSFSPEDKLTYEQAHEIGRQLAARFSSFQAVIATHTDCDHIHNHIILNSVDMETGYKFQQTKQELERVKLFSNELCNAHGLSTIRLRRGGVNKSYDEWRDEKQGHPTWRSLIRHDIDKAIKRCLYPSHLVPEMKKRGYEVKQGKDISFRAPGQKNFIRLGSLGENYSQDKIRERISSQQSSFGQTWKRPNPQIRYKGTFDPKTHKKPEMTHFQKLYWHYMYLLGKVKSGKAKKSTTIVLRPDTVKFKKYLELHRYIHENKIKSLDDVAERRIAIMPKMDVLIKERAQLHKEKKKSAYPQIQLDRIAQINLILREMRKEIAKLNFAEESFLHIEVQLGEIKEAKEMLKQKQAEKSKKQPKRGYVAR